MAPESGSLVSCPSDSRSLTKPGTETLSALVSMKSPFSQIWTLSSSNSYWMVNGKSFSFWERTTNNPSAPRSNKGRSYHHKQELLFQWFQESGCLRIETCRPSESSRRLCWHQRLRARDASRAPWHHCWEESLEPGTSRCFLAKSSQSLVIFGLPLSSEVIKEVRQEDPDRESIHDDCHGLQLIRLIESRDEQLQCPLFVRWIRSSWQSFLLLNYHRKLEYSCNWRLCCRLCRQSGWYLPESILLWFLKQNIKLSFCGTSWDVISFS